jgi:hypothetical protein
LVRCPNVDAIAEIMSLSLSEEQFEVLTCLQTIGIGAEMRGGDGWKKMYK